jgi:hypothetical protein
MMMAMAMASGQMPGGDPAMMGAMPPGAAGAPMFPTTDPNFMAEALSQIVQMQQMDQSAMGEAQHSALVGNPIFQALASGAPMGPGAGQDGAAIGPEGSVMPDPTMPGGIV